VRILITGAAGFVGRAVARTLAEAGHELTLAIHQRNLPRSFSSHEVVRGDLRDPKFSLEVLTTGTYDRVCHLAALTGVRDSVNNEADYFGVNVGGILNLLTAIQSIPSERPPMIVFASTRAVYDTDTGNTTIREKSRTTMSNPYGLSKLFAERLLSLYCTVSGLSAWSLRCFNISGGLPGIVDPDTSRLIPRIVAAARGEIPPPTIQALGAIIDYSHVADVAHAFRLAIESEPDPGVHQIVNVGSGVGTSVAEVIRGLERALRCEVPVILRKPEIEAVGDGPVADVSAIRDRLGWKSTRSFAEIVADAAHNRDEEGHAHGPR
jgi:UDP-glucose 4-epimerase